MNLEKIEELAVKLHETYGVLMADTAVGAYDLILSYYRCEAIVGLVSTLMLIPLLATVFVKSYRLIIRETDAPEIAFVASVLITGFGCLLGLPLRYVLLNCMYIYDPRFKLIHQIIGV